MAGHSAQSQAGSGWLYDFGLCDERCLRRGSDGVTVARVEVVPKGLSSVFSCSFREGHMSRSSQKSNFVHYRYPFVFDLSEHTDGKWGSGVDWEKSFVFIFGASYI